MSQLEPEDNAVCVDDQPMCNEDVKPEQEERVDIPESVDVVQEQQVELQDHGEQERVESMSGSEVNQPDKLADVQQEGIVDVQSSDNNQVAESAQNVQPSHNAKVQERAQRIGLLTERIDTLEKEGIFTKERKLELSNLRKKLRIDKHNHNRHLKKIQTGQQVSLENQPDDQVMTEQEPVLHDHEQEQDESIVEDVKQEEEEEEDFEEQYRQILVKQMQAEKQLQAQQKEFARKQFEEIASNVKMLQEKWKQKDTPAPIKQLSSYDTFLEKYKNQRQQKSRRTLLGEAIYKAHTGLN